MAAHCAEDGFCGQCASTREAGARLRDLTDEVVQETWLIAVRRIRGFDPANGSFAGWLRGIAANVLRNHFRRETRRNNHAALGELREAVACPADTELEKRECAERVAHALASLPERYEAVLQAKYL